MLKIALQVQHSHIQASIRIQLDQLPIGLSVVVQDLKCAAMRADA